MFLSEMNSAERSRRKSRMCMCVYVGGDDGEVFSRDVSRLDQDAKVGCTSHTGGSLVEIKPEVLGK